jgi:uncharacterized protein YjbI with pentapeptide repeats
MEGSATLIDWDDDAFEHVLEQLRADGTIDAARVRVSAERLTRILEAAPDPDRPWQSLLKDANFDGATFEGGASFVRATFSGDTYFREATFSGDADFGGATFSGIAYFDDAIFSDDADFGRATFGAPIFVGATFEREANFVGATFERVANFREATFSGDAVFILATFEGAAGFVRATFEREARFSEAEFQNEARFETATFKSEAHFPNVTCRGEAGFRDAVFGGFAHFPDAEFGSHAEFRGSDLKAGFRFGPALVVGRLELDNASLGNVNMQVSTCHLSCRGTRFHEPAHLKVRWAEVHLEESAFDRASTLALSPSWENVDERRLPPRGGTQPGSDEVGEKEEAGESPAMPRLASLRGADVASLTLADINLESCVFESALNLDQLRLATQCPFANAPSGHLQRRRSVPFVWQWTRRITICEEGSWRVQQGEVMTRRRRHWRDDWAAVGTGCGTEATGEPSTDATEAQGRSEADRLGRIYRSLRKAREDESNTPGAGDFYYGEMEMRRHGAASRPEWAVIWLYWLVSGYGLRASRALIALALTIALGALLLGLYGFDAGKHPDEGALLFAAESSISLLRPPDTKNLTDVGHVVQIVLRLAGPLFFGLALLSLRGRVKR